MKVQITVDDEVWRQAKANAALKGVSLGEFVGEALGKAVKSITEHIKQPSIRSYEVKKVEVGKSWGEVGEAPKTPPVAVSEPARTTLREGYSWCTACGKKQVKLPLFLCNDCRGDK